MHLTDSTYTSSTQHRCRLPSIKDLLRESEPKRSSSEEPYSAIEFSSSIFNEWLGSYPNQDKLYNRFSACPARLPDPAHITLLPDSRCPPQHISNRQSLYYENNQFSTGAGSYRRVAQKNVIVPQMEPGRTVRRLEPLTEFSEGSRSKPDHSLGRPLTLTTSSNDKHKQSEKHRRDEMAAFVQIAERVRESVPPGIRFGCSICLEDVSVGENICSPSIVPDGILSVAMGVKSKGTKNQSIQEGMMFQFQTVLHQNSEVIGVLLDEIRADLAMLWSDKLSRRDDSVENSKSNVDSKAEVYMKFLRQTRYACELHGISLCACGKHETEDWPANTFETLMTPPSPSLGNCSTAGQKRSREPTEEEGELKQNVRMRRRSMTSP